MADNVNVLDVLDDAAKQLSDSSTACAYDDGKELREARARIAELIAAASNRGDFLGAYSKAVASSQPADWHEAALLAKQWECRLSAALSACTGGSNG